MIITLALTAGCASTQQEYETAYFSHDVDKLETFIQEHPGDRYFADAQRNQAKWLLEEADKNPNIETYEALLKKFPHNPNLNTQATKKLSELYFEKVQKENTKSALENFIQRFPFSRERHFAAVMLDNISFNETVAVNTKDAYTKYLAGKPSEQNRRQAMDKLARLELDAIKQHESIADYQAFMDKYKESPVAVEAANRLVNMQIPSSVYDSRKGSIMIHWGKLNMIKNNQLNARFGEGQQQLFQLSQDIRVCGEKSKRLTVNDLTTDSEVTLASFANKNRSEVFAIYLGEVKTKMVEKETVLAPGSAIAFDLPSCFPPQISVNR